MTPTTTELEHQLHDLADRVADTPAHRRAHVAVLLDRLERLVPAHLADDLEPQDTP